MHSLPQAKLQILVLRHPLYTCHPGDTCKNLTCLLKSADSVFSCQFSALERTLNQPKSSSIRCRQDVCQAYLSVSGSREHLPKQLVPFPKVSGCSLFC